MFWGFLFSFVFLSFSGSFCYLSQSLSLTPQRNIPAMKQMCVWETIPGGVVFRGCAWVRIFGGCLESGVDNLMIHQCFLIILLEDFRQLFWFLSDARSEREPYLCRNLSSKGVVVLSVLGIS